MSSGGQRFAERLWYGGSPWAYLLLPLTAVFAVIVHLRRALFRAGFRTSSKVGVPVVVVGNLTVGGTGKTPAVIALVDALGRRGFLPGVVSRGYGGRAEAGPRLVDPDGDPADFGDEPVLIARRTGRPVAVCPDRVAAARLLVSHGVDVIVTDDGLQHYPLARDYEIAVVDGRRGLGNGWLLPAGPLREPASRLCSVQHVLVNGEADFPLPDCVRGRTSGFHLEPTALVSVNDNATRPATALSGQDVHGVAAIGNPRRFFATLESLGMRVTSHALRDHEPVDPAALGLGDGRPVVMTEKDAVKFPAEAGLDACYLSVTANVSEALVDDIVTALELKPLT